MGKELIIRVRVDEAEAEMLNALEKKYNLTKSQIIRQGIADYEAIREKKLYPLNLNGILGNLSEEYTIDSCGIIDNDILLGKGVWMDLHTDWWISPQKRVEIGNSCLTIKGNQIHIEGGFINDINKILMLLHMSRKEGGNMSYIKINDDEDKVICSVLVSYEIKIDGQVVFVTLNSVNESIIYELRPDTNIKTVEDIKNYLEKILMEVVDSGYTLEISEYLERMYVTFGYRNKIKTESRQFTALKH